MTPRDLWDVFETAYLQATRTYPFDEDEDEPPEFNYSLTVRQIKSSYGETINYWMNPNTIGGNILHNFGYIDAVDSAVLEMVEAYNTKLSSLKKALAHEVFSS